MAPVAAAGGGAETKASKSRAWLAFGAFAGLLLLVAGSGMAWLFSQEESSKPPPRAEIASPPPTAPQPSSPQGSPNREAAFRHFTQGMEAMEVIERGRGDENTLISALEHAEQATGLDPSVAAYWHLLGYAYSHFKGDQQASVMAEDALQKALAINGSNTASRLLLARLLLERESYALALDQLEWAGRKDAKLINSLLVAEMCRAYVADELGERGEKFFREMLQQRGDSSSLRLGLAILLQEQGKKDEALRQLAGVLADSNASADDLEHARLLDKVWRGGKA